MQQRKAHLSCQVVSSRRQHASCTPGICPSGVACISPKHQQQGQSQGDGSEEGLHTLDGQHGPSIPLQHNVSADSACHRQQVRVRFWACSTYRTNGDIHTDEAARFCFCLQHMPGSVVHDAALLHIQLHACKLHALHDLCDAMPDTHRQLTH